MRDFTTLDELIHG